MRNFSILVVFATYWVELGGYLWYLVVDMQLFGQFVLKVADLVDLGVFWGIFLIFVGRQYRFQGIDIIKKKV